MSLTSYQAAPPRVASISIETTKIKSKMRFRNNDHQICENGSSGRIRTYDQSVNSRPLYH